jgi:prolyl oligopeptidase
VDPKNPDPKGWQNVIAEKPELLEGVGTAGGKLFAQYLKDASTRVYQHTYDGKPEREIKLPGIGTAGGFYGEKTHKELFYTFTSFTSPATIYRYDIASGKSELYRKPELKLDTEATRPNRCSTRARTAPRCPCSSCTKRASNSTAPTPRTCTPTAGSTST